MADWNAQLYQKFINQRSQPARDLVGRVDIEPKTVFDLGCGPGNSTRIIADRFKNAAVLGGDFSDNMIITAKKDNPDLDFIKFDAQNDFAALPHKFDLIFSNACIQWVPNHRKLLCDMINSLNDGGMIAVQTPLQSKHPMHSLLKRISHSDKWKDNIKIERVFYNLTEEEYFDLLSEISSEFDIWETVYCHAMPSHESIVEWYKGTGMRPYLEQLDTEQQQKFENDVLNGVREIYPIRTNGQIMFYFPRLFFTAKK